MKTNVKLLLLIGIVIASCSVPPGVDVGDENAKLNDNITEVPQNIFEGTWTWIKTTGEGIGGHYEEDSTSVGYSVHYAFSHDDLQTYRNGEKFENFNYTFTYNEGNPLGSMLELKSGEELSESFYYVIKTEGEIRYLILKNTEPCCDNTFEKTFKYIGLQ